MDNDLLSEIICEIFSELTVLNSSFGSIYFKHFNQLESRSIYSKKKLYIEEAVSKGLFTDEESIKSLIKDGIWENKKEDQINQIKTQIKSLEDITHKIKLPSQRESHRQLISKEQKKLFEKTKERKELIGMTAERYAEEKTHREFFDSITFLDPECKIKVIDKISYEEKEKEMELFKLQNLFFEKFTDDNISKAVLSPFYSSFLPFSEDVINIFGKPMKDMSTFQIKMASYGRSFLNIFKNASKEIPDYVSKDPELLIDWYNSQKSENSTNNRHKATEGSGGTTYFGATQEDIEKIADSDEKAIKLSQAIHKEGGNLNMEQMMKLHGV